MSEPVTEIVQIPLAAGIDLSTGDSQRIWNETLSTIRSQPGCTAVYSGLRLENPQIAQMAIDWENLAAHKTFEAQPTYGAFIQNLAPLVGGPLKVFHVALPLSTPFSGPGSAPVTECLNLYFGAGYAPADFARNWAQFHERGLQEATQALGIAGAWSLDEVEHEGVWDKEELGAEGPSFAIFVGWPSVLAHMKFRESEVFPSLVGYLRDGPKATEVFHVEFKKFE
ncbi:hypothetical protein K505DRAFT_411893 [Melanomma pulvis-pyrius CBS 109.77]|uniref:ABM domain-containing protein n=1 Tax=Melanomma pulvis-pyrius CBS 109.77 TaxID=1314802 RepID=A0A6A6WRJ0_9PLEO|nr:hypothetical protein K505DRAFT_411893 [Melanomma pulvis-pyrius CBS 109.77]